MRAKIYLNRPLTENRYGLHFEKGEAHTDNEYLIKKLQSKGIRVEIIKEEKELEDMTKKELVSLAEEKQINIPEKANKDEIILYLKGEKILLKDDSQSSDNSQDDKKSKELDGGQNNEQDNPSENEE